MVIMAVSKTDGIKTITDRYGLKISDAEPRKSGNELIRRMINMEYAAANFTGHMKIHDDVINKYDAVHHALLAAKDTINYLIDARTDKNPKTWKWLSPIVTMGDDSKGMTVYDGHNGWMTYAYKGRGALTLMSPMQFMQKAAPDRIRDLPDYRGGQYSNDRITQLMTRMREGRTIDSPYLIIDNEGRIQHEGMHRAHAAVLSGIKLIPVYIYKNGKPWTEMEIKKISKYTMEVLNHE